MKLATLAFLLFSAYVVGVDAMAGAWVAKQLIASDCERGARKFEVGGKVFLCAEKLTQPN